MRLIKKLENFGAKKSSRSDEEKENALKKLELQVGSLPEVYRKVILYFGSDIDFENTILFTPLVPSPWTRKKGKTKGKNILGYLYGVFSEYKSGTLFDHLSTYKGRIPADFLPIGEGPGGNQICIGINGDVRGAVYFWDHEGEICAKKVGNSAELYLISKSLEEFLESLEVDDSEDDCIDGVEVSLDF